MRPDETLAAVQDTLGIDVAALLAWLGDREPIPLEGLGSESDAETADGIVEGGWVLGPHPMIRLDLPIDWSTLCMSHRSWNFHLHAWDFMDPVLRAFQRTGERRYLDWCVERAVSWAETFNEGDARGTMAWYDMAIGLRGFRLAYVVEQALLHHTEPDAVTTLLRCVMRHQAEFAKPEAFNARNNHAVYVALGELALARRLRRIPGMDVLAARGRERMDLMARQQFAADGGHVEHSPDYHRMVLSSFSGALESALLDGDEVRARVELAEDVLGWFIQPNGELAQVGDSIARPMASPDRCTSCPTTEFLVSGGVRGRPDDRNLLVLPHSGYAIVRSPQPTGTHDHEASSYVVLAACFHSRAHKQADDLAITWFDHGRELLIDAGRYGYLDLLPKDSPQRRMGYFYDAPERQYVESTRAHNTVEADGLDHNVATASRTAPRSRMRRNATGTSGCGPGWTTVRGATAESSFSFLESGSSSMTP